MTVHIIMSLYRNRYRIESARLKNWDYTSNGYYYITICTKNRIHYLGNIINGRIILSKIGKIANQFWLEIPNHFPFVQLDKFVIMPNHIHGIIIINKSNIQTPKFYEETHPYKKMETPRLGYIETPKLGVSTGKPGDLGMIINQYKRICTIKSRKINPCFEWQPRYYDHIIRNNQDLNRI